MRSVRDSDVNARQWLRNKTNGNQLQGLTNQVAKTARDLARLRRVRPGGGGSTPAATGMVFKGEFDPTKSYSLNDVVVISLGDNSGTWIAIAAAPVSNPVVYPYNGAGIWQQLTFGLLGRWQ